jgi:hypothetical protein
MIEKLQVIVARNAKQVVCATVCQAIQQIISDAIGGTHSRCPYYDDLNLSIEEA